MNNYVRRAATLGLLCTKLIVGTSEFRTPISLEWGPIHHPLYHIDESWWIGSMPECCRENTWEIDAWAGAYHRSATKVFMDDCGGVTRCKKDLSALFFGKELFTLEEAFPGGIITCNQDPVNNPFVRFSRLNPQIKYREGGVYLGVHAERSICSDNWRIGGRVSIPYKVIQVGPVNDVSVSEEGLGDVIARRPWDLITGAGGAAPNNNRYDYAYRLDLLACLFRTSPLRQSFLPLVDLGPTVGILPADRLTKVAGNSAGVRSSNPLGDDYPPVFLIKSTDGSVPDQVAVVTTPPSLPPRTAFAKQQAQATGGALPADGSGADGAVFYFGDETVDYRSNLGTDRAAQATLWIVPHLNDAGQAFANGAGPFFSAVEEVLRSFEQFGDGSVTEILDNIGINLDRFEKITGLGDMRTELYGGYTACNMYMYGVVGLIWPTGRKNKDPKRVYFMPTGNNGHFEFILGMEAGYRPFDWFAIDFDVAYYRAIKKNELRAGSFKGAQVFGIGPTLETDVSWNRGLMHLDLTFFHPCNSDCGATLSYELYARSKDDLSYCQKTAPTLFGVIAELDPDVAASKTSVQSHKFRGELFYRYGYGEIFAGGSQVFAGKNAWQESELHIGFACYF